MNNWIMVLHRRLASESAIVRVMVATARGSTPREVGACMLVGAIAEDGSIGGGHLELKAMEIARQMLSADLPPRVDRFVLGATLGQCCGGVMELWFECFTAEDRDFLERAMQISEDGKPVVLTTSLNVNGKTARTIFAPAGAIYNPSCGVWLPPLQEGVAKGDFVILSASEGSAFAALPRETNSRSFAGAQNDRGLLRHPLEGGGANRWHLEIPDPIRNLLTSDNAPRAALIRPNDAPQHLLIERIDFQHMPVWLFGAGHVGKALVKVLSDLPFDVTWIDNREATFPAAIPNNITQLITEFPADEVRAAPKGTCFLILTHSHDLDYEICRAILNRDDFLWAGLIGSRSKAARFSLRLARHGVPAERIARLICPIGIGQINSKLPAAIAVSVAAQLLQLAERAEKQCNTNDTGNTRGHKSGAHPTATDLPERDIYQA